MIVEVSLGLLALTFVYLFYALYYKPKKICDHYVKTLRDLGYKVFQYDFKFMGFPIIKQGLKDKAQKKDGWNHSKTVLAGYDATVCNVFQYPMVAFLSPNLIKQAVGIDKIKILPKKPFGLTLQKYLMQQGLIYSEGQAWKQSKKVLSKVFSYDFIIQQIPDIIEVCDRAFQKHQKLSLQKHGQLDSGKSFRIDLLKAGTDIASTVVTTGFLGMDTINDQVEGDPIHILILRLFHSGVQIGMKEKLVTLFGYKFVELGTQKHHRQHVRKNMLVRNYLRKQIVKIKNEMNQPKQGKVKTSKNLVEAILRYSQDSGLYTQDKIIDEIVTFLFAGSDTTSNFIVFLLFSIFKNPDILQKVKAEIAQHIKTKQDINIQNLRKLVYLQSVQLQTNRYYGPVNALIMRECIQDTYVNDVPISKGLLVRVQTKPMLFDSNTFQKPFEFMPQRWLDAKNKQLTNLVGYAFSGGPRTCIGKHLSLLESKIAVVRFIQKYEKLTQLHERILDYSIVEAFLNNQVQVTRF